MDYNLETQTLFLEMMTSEHSIFALANPILKPEYFRDELKSTMGYIQEYSDQYNTLPSLKMIVAKTGLVLEHIPDFDRNHIRSCLDEIEKFCRFRACQLALIEGAELVAKDPLIAPDALPEIMKKASLISLSKDLGLDFWADPIDVFDRLQEQHALVSSGWKSFDYKLQGGFGFGELEVIVAPSGGGKSLVMQNLALNYSLQGFNVMYLTYELSQDLVAKRMYSMGSNVPMRNIFTEGEKVKTNINILKKKQEKPVGFIQLKFLRSNTTVAMIESYIKEWEMKNKTTPHIILIDYFDLLAPKEKISAENIGLRDKFVAEELRDLAAGRTLEEGKPTLVISASQVTKEAMDEEVGAMGKVAGGAGKVRTADTVWAANSSKTMKERGEMAFVFMKTRNSGGAGDKLIMKYNTETLRISDMDDWESKCKGDYNAPIKKNDNTTNEPTVSNHDRNAKLQSILNGIKK